MLVRRKLTVVPWMKDRLRRYFTFLSSSARILPVVALRRATSWSARPRLFDQLDVAERLGGRAGERRRLVDDLLLDDLDLARQHRGERADERDRERSRRGR